MGFLFLRQRWIWEDLRTGRTAWYTSHVEFPSNSRKSFSRRIDRSSLLPPIPATLRAFHTSACATHTLRGTYYLSNVMSVPMFVHGSVWISETRRAKAIWVEKDSSEGAWRLLSVLGILWIDKLYPAEDSARVHEYGSFHYDIQSRVWGLVKTCTSYKLKVWYKSMSDVWYVVQIKRIKRKTY